jgi:hypothetical protein
MSQYMENMLLAQRIIIESVLESQIITNEERSDKKMKVMENLPIRKFLSGSFVTVEYHDGKIPSKLSLPRRGPFRVIDHSEDKVHVQNLVTLEEEYFHSSICNQFEYDPNRVDPIDVARKALPNPEYVVKDVLEHVPKDFKPNTPRANLQFKIKWLHWDEISWEPWENLRRVEKVHQYLILNKMKYLIPKSCISERNIGRGSND